MKEFYLVNGKILDVRTGKFIKADLKITGKQIASVQEKAPTEACGCGSRRSQRPRRACS